MWSRPNSSGWRSSVSFLEHVINQTTSDFHQSWMHMLTSGISWVTGTNPWASKSFWVVEEKSVLGVGGVCSARIFSLWNQKKPVRSWKTGEGLSLSEKKQRHSVEKYTCEILPHFNNAAGRSGAEEVVWPVNLPQGPKKTQMNSTTG